MSHATLIRRRPPEPSRAVVRTQSPEEREYQRRLRQIAARERRFSELDAELVVLRGALGQFASICDARVGDLLSELRRVSRLAADYEQRVQRLRFGYPPDRLGRPLDEADDDPFAVPGDDATAEPPADQGEARQAIPRDRTRDAEIKRAYRDLAKRCHPDYAKTDAERRQREAVMQRINEAFRDRDLDTLQSLARQTEASDPTFADRPLHERLAWAEAEVARWDRLLTDLKAEYLLLRRGEVHRLWRRHESGEPVLEQLEDDLEARLVAAGRRLDRLVTSYRRALDERQRLSPGLFPAF